MRTNALVGGVNGQPGWERAAGPPRAARAAAPGTRWSFGLLLLFLAMLFANLPLLVPALEPLAPAQTLAVGALLVLFVERAAARQPIRLAWPETHLLLTFVGLALISSFTALWPRHAIENTLLLLKFAAVYVLIVNTVENWSRVRRTFAVLAIGAFVPAAGAIHGWQAGNTLEGRAVWIGVFGNPNDLAYTMVVMLPIVLALAAAVRGWRRLALLAVAGTCLVAAFLTYSRGGMLALGLVLILCLLRWARPVLLVPALLVLAALLAWVVPARWERHEGFGELQSDYTVQQRLGTIRAGLAMLADRPLLGVGPGCSLIGFPDYAPPELLRTGWLHTHNTFIQVLSETGVLGGTAWALVVGTALIKARRTARRMRARGRRDLARLVSALEISIWGFLACSMAGGYMLSWFPYLVLALVSATGAIREPAPARATRTADLWGRNATCAASPAF